jgi:lipopolysaccharide/colanic/teichoic acid biosynthesis glycosyltransferase
MESSMTNSYRRKVASNRFARILKRSFDIVVSFFALLFLAPFFGLIAIAIKRDSEGPVFYGGPRVGKNGKIFNILKFRTMYEDPESYRGPRVTAKGDPRITPLGKWLRDTKLNELPQFWNVFKGEMSMVGPRPEDPSFAKTWPITIRDEILSMKPGVTSPATVIYHDEESILSGANFLQQYLKEIGPDKLRLDQLYIQHHSFMLDLDIMLWTFLILLPRIRSNTPPEEMLFVGPLTRLVRRYMNWVTLDLIVTFVVVGASGLFWRTIMPINAGLVQALTMTFIFSLIFSLTGAVMGVNKINWTKASPYNVFNLLPAWAVASIIALIVNWSLQVLPIGLVLLACTVSLGGFITTRYSRRLLTGVMSRILKHTGKADKPCEQVLIIGSGRTAEHVCTLMDHPSNVRKFEVVGVVDDDFFTQGMSIYGKKVLGRLKDLERILDRRTIDMVFLASHTITMRQERKIADLCTAKGVRTVVIPDIFGSIQNLYEETVQEKTKTEGQNVQIACLNEVKLEEIDTEANR